MSADQKLDNKRGKLKMDDRNHREEEFASEITPYRISQEDSFDEPTDAETSESTIGWVGLAMSIASLFVLPQWLSLAGIVLGGAAWLSGSRGLGLWSILIGSLSITVYLVLVPYYLR